jgi:hypothetical protein
MAFECLGDVASWGEGFAPRVYVTPYEVYLWRASLSGVDFQEPKQAALFVQAIGKKIAGFDIRGICVIRGASASVDVVFTARDYLVNIWDDASDVAGFVSQDADVRASFPGLAVTSSGLFQLTGPPASVDFWLSAPILWSKSNNKPQKAFSDLLGIYEGIADDGLNLKIWNVPVVLGPPGTTPPKTTEPAGTGSSGTVIWILGGIVALALIGAKASKASK